MVLSYHTNINNICFDYEMVLIYLMIALNQVIVIDLATITKCLCHDESNDSEDSGLHN